jgi:hypothetical protein
MLSAVLFNSIFYDSRVRACVMETRPLGTVETRVGPHADCAKVRIRPGPVWYLTMHFSIGGTTSTPVCLVQISKDDGRSARVFWCVGTLWFGQPDGHLRR